MRNLKTQGGITLLGFLMVLMIVGFFAFLVMRLFPVYSEYYSVVTAMKGVQAEPGVATWSVDKIKDSLDRKMYISYVTSVKKQNVRVIRQGGGNQLNVKYEVRGPLLYNLEYIASFNKTVDLTRQGSVD
jgi:hypothetical protein